MRCEIPQGGGRIGQKFEKTMGVAKRVMERDRVSLKELAK